MRLLVPAMMASLLLVAGCAEKDAEKEESMMDAAGVAQ
jgi:hypothetical protein